MVCDLEGQHPLCYVRPADRIELSADPVAGSLSD